MEDALSARTQLRAEEAKLRLALRKAQRANQLAQTRYEAGYTDIQQWLYTQDALRARERSLAINRLSQLNNLVAIYKALGLGAQHGSIACRRS